MQNINYFQMIYEDFQDQSTGLDCTQLTTQGEVDMQTVIGVGFKVNWLNSRKQDLHAYGDVVLTNQKLILKFLWDEGINDYWSAQWSVLEMPLADIWQEAWGKSQQTGHFEYVGACKKALFTNLNDSQSGKRVNWLHFNLQFKSGGFESFERLLTNQIFNVRNYDLHIFDESGINYQNDQQQQSHGGIGMSNQTRVEFQTLSEMTFGKSQSSCFSNNELLENPSLYQSPMQNLQHQALISSPSLQNQWHQCNNAQAVKLTQVSQRHRVNQQAMQFPMNGQFQKPINFTQNYCQQEEEECQDYPMRRPMRFVYENPNQKQDNSTMPALVPMRFTHLNPSF